MSVRITAILGAIVLAGYFAAAAFAPAANWGSPHFASIEHSLSGSILGFGNADDPTVKKRIEKAQNDYERARAAAITKAEAAASSRDSARLAAHVASGLALTLSLATALIGAAFGTANGDSLENALAGRGKRLVLVLAACSTFLVGAADRLSSYAASEAENVSNITASVVSVDGTVAHALSPEEISGAAKDLQLSLLKI